MGLFTRRHAGSGNGTGTSSLPSGLKAERDYNWLDENDDVATKVWLPERVDQLLARLAEELSESVSAIVRRMLFVYLYGRNDFVVLFRAQDTERDDEPGVKFSRKPQPRGAQGGRMPQMGKNYRDLKLWLPRRMCDDLRRLAEERGISLSQHIREVIVTELLGHMYLSERETLVREPDDYQTVSDDFEQRMNEWERGKPSKA